MKNCILLVIVFFTSRAIAKDVLVCQFTEPFFTITFDANTGEINYKGIETYNPATDDFDVLLLSEKAVLKNKSSTMIGNEYQLVDVTSGKSVLELTLDGQGSDGMSDSLYPFSAIYQNYHGGCSTDTAPVVDMNAVLEELNLEISL